MTATFVMMSAASVQENLLVEWNCLLNNFADWSGSRLTMRAGEAGCHPWRLSVNLLKYVWLTHVRCTLQCSFAFERLVEMILLIIIQMGLPEGHSVLLHFSNNGRPYQAVLVSMSSAPSRSKKGEHAMWKHVLPVSTDFAWLPEDVADAFCSLSLQQDQTRPYGSFHELQLGFNEHYQAWLHIEGLYYLGETRSVDEFNIFSQMPAERLCLGCGVQSDERFGLMPPQDRGKLFAATLRLMQLVLTDRLKDVTDDEEQIRQTLHPLIHNRDGHFLATLSALLLSLLEGKTDCPISGVLGGRKNPCSSSNYSRADHCWPVPEDYDPDERKRCIPGLCGAPCIGLSLPSWIESKIGRLVGFMALHNQTTGTTKLDIPSAHRHDVIGSKQVIIGCGGGFRHECASKYSPVAQWISEVDLTLHDESQQYGNLDETAAIARLPHNCLVMWLGDHRQTPGGLRKSTAARRFRRKLLKQPLALRGNSVKVLPNTLYQIVERYLRVLPILLHTQWPSQWRPIYFSHKMLKHAWRPLRKSYLGPMILGWMVLFPAQRLQSSGWPPTGKMLSQWLPKGWLLPEACEENKIGPSSYQAAQESGKSPMKQWLRSDIQS